MTHYGYNCPFRWSDVVAGMPGAFLFFVVLTYIFLFWSTRRLRVA